MLSASETAQRQAREYNTLTNLLTRYQRQKDKGVLTEEQYNTKVQATQTRLTALTTQTETLTLKQRLLAGATQMAVTAFNMLKTMAVTAVIGLIISGIAKLVNRQKEQIEQAAESAKKINEQTKSFEELKKKYEEICDSTDDEKTKNEQLNEIKQELVDTYGLEKTALEELNTERQKGVNLLDEEFEKKNRNSRNEWLDKNKGLIQDAKEKMAYGGTDYFSTYLPDNNISESILKLFDNKDAFGDTGYVNLEFDYTDTVDRLEKLKNIYNEILEIQSHRKLTDDEQQLLNSVKNTLDSVQDIYDSYYDTYSNSAKYEAKNIIEDYLKTDFGNLENVGKDTFDAWSKGLIKQARTEEQRRYIQEYIEDTFPDISKYFNNLNLAKSKFVEGKFNAKPISDYIESLSDEKLEILVQLDKNVFDNGIEVVEKAIADFKSDPDNAIEAETDTSSLDDLKKSYDDISKSADSFIKNQKLLTTALDEQKKHGQLSASTIRELSEAGYSEALVTDKVTGAVTLNMQAYEKLNTQKQEKIHLDLVNEKNNLEDKLKDEEAAVSNLRQEYEALAKADVEANTGRLSEITLELAKRGANIEDIRELITQINGDIISLDAPTFENNSIDKNKEAFNKLYSEKKHQLEMNQITEEEYINWLDGAYKTYFSDLTKYQDEYNKYEEEVYKYRTDREQKLFDTKMDNLEKLADKSLENPSSEKDFDNAKGYINTAISDTEQRIADIKSGKISGDEDDIKSLNDDLDTLKDKLEDIDKQKIEFEIDIITKKNDNLEREYDKTGNESLIDDMEKNLLDERSIIQNEIQRLLDEGYSENSDIVQEWVDKENSVNDELKDIYDRRVDIIKDSIDEQLDTVDREIEQTGDTKLYQVRINILTEGINDIEKQINSYLEKGYTEDSDTIKELRKKQTDLRDDIIDTNKDAVQAQVDAYNDAIQNEIDILNEYKDAQDDIFDEKIKALEEQKKALEE